MKSILLATAALIGLAGTANAALITGFAQQSVNNTVTATDDGTVTNISYTDQLVTLGGGILGAIPSAVMTLAAHSIDAAVAFGGAIIQHYSGTFCISSGAGCTGNFLSGVFTDAAFGAAGGPGLTVNVNNPPEALTLASNVLTASQLQPPSSFNLAFTNLSPPLSIDGTTIAAFQASFAGDISASSVEAFEPASLALMGIGLLGLAVVRRRRVTTDPRLSDYSAAA